MNAIRKKDPISGYINKIFNIDQNVLVSEEHAIQLVKIPKNASSFFRALFLINHSLARDFNAQRETPKAFEERTRAKNIPVKKKTPATGPTYVTCVVLRDPFSRMVSAFLDRVVKKVGTGARDEPGRRFYADVGRSAGRRVTPRNITFNDFLTYAVSCRDYQREKHYRTQASFFQDYRVDLFSTVQDLRPLFSLMQRRGMTIPEQSLSGSKKTRYARRGGRACQPAYHAMASQLKAQPAFPPPQAFYCEQTVHMLLSGYCSDIDLYCRVREIHRASLIGAYIDA